EFGAAAEHALRYLATITAPPYLVRVGLVFHGWQPGARQGHRDKAARGHDRNSAPDNLRLVICPDIGLGQPDEIAARMWENFDHSSHPHARCRHRAKR